MVRILLIFTALSAANAAPNTETTDQSELISCFKALADVSRGPGNDYGNWTDGKSGGMVLVPSPDGDRDNIYIHTDKHTYFIKSPPFRDGMWDWFFEASLPEVGQFPLACRYSGLSRARLKEVDDYYKQPATERSDFSVWIERMQNDTGGAKSPFHFECGGHASEGEKVHKFSLKPLSASESALQKPLRRVMIERLQSVATVYGKILAKYKRDYEECDKNRHNNEFIKGFFNIKCGRPPEKVPFVRGLNQCANRADDGQLTSLVNDPELGPVLAKARADVDAIKVPRYDSATDTICK
jgi:hypothetical protein